MVLSGRRGSRSLGRIVGAGGTTGPVANYNLILANLLHDGIPPSPQSAIHTFVQRIVLLIIATRPGRFRFRPDRLCYLKRLSTCAFHLRLRSDTTLRRVCSINTMRHHEPQPLCLSQCHCHGLAGRS